MSLVPKKKSPYKDVTDEDYSAASHVDSQMTPQEKYKYFTPTYKKVGMKIGDLARGLKKRVKDNVSEIARLAKKGRK